MTAAVKIVWVYRRTGRGGTEEGEQELTTLINEGWYIVSTSVTTAKDNVPILCVVLQRDES